MPTPLEAETRLRLRKALGHLRTSLRKCGPILTKPLASLDEDELEALEGLAGRFGRASDIASKRFLRGLVLQEEPDFSGSTRDLLNYCEKRGWIRSAQLWMRLREVRNLVVHEYQEDELEALYQEVLVLSQELLLLEAQV